MIFNTEGHQTSWPSIKVVTTKKKKKIIVGLHLLQGENLDTRFFFFFKPGL